MPVWILIVVVAQLLNAAVAIIDKHIIASKKVAKPIVYAFYVSVLSVMSILVFALGFLPFDFGEVILPRIQNIAWPSVSLIFISILAAYAFILALFTSYSALQDSDASDVIPVVGSTSAIFTFIISFIFLSEILTKNFFYGFVFLVAGMIILSHFRFTWKSFSLSIASGIFFAIYFASMKHLFNDYDFDQAFFWTRIAMLVVALTVLFVPMFKDTILNSPKTSGIRGGLWVLGNSVLGGIAGIALLKATELGSVTLVQALGGLQFAFLIIISVLFGRITPTTFGENNSFADVVQKVFSVALIIIGFYLLFI